MQPFVQPSATDQAILEDKDLDYRVLNLSTNTFNENNTSYWHKSIGGYHAAKLRRYQELIEEHIQNEMQTLFKELPATGGNMDSVAASHLPVLNLLNTRYFIFPLQDGSTAPIYNPHALGNAWFVSEVLPVKNANEEIDALHRIDPAITAVVDERFVDVVGAAVPTDSLATVELTDYQPNALKYKVSSSHGGVVVFSEIYYPGWQSFIDGQPVAHGRADYVLRALQVPGGEHVVEFTFDPQSLHVTETIAYGALLLLLLAALFAVYRAVRKNWPIDRTTNRYSSDT